MYLYDHTTFKISKIVTKQYSTSFFLASSLLSKEMRSAIFSIYAFVRFADEIVDSFHDHDKPFLLQKFEADYYDAYSRGISLNPILHSFQLTIKKFNIADEYVQAFLNSMKFDLEKKEYKKKEEIDEYIYGSADVVGLMCLMVFCGGNKTQFEELKKYAVKLGSAFQKINFLRDLKNDTENLNRIYFPQLAENEFDEVTKKAILSDIENDFNMAYLGIKKLPKGAKLAVLVAYSNYYQLLKKMEKIPASKIKNHRIRISNFAKGILLFKSILKCKLNLI